MELGQAAAQRLGQIEKHFSGSAGSLIRNVYIISAARTPTAKVGLQHHHLSMELEINAYNSLMALSKQCPRLG
jgi:hypothetical protein